MCLLPIASCPTNVLDQLVPFLAPVDTDSAVLHLRSAAKEASGVDNLVGCRGLYRFLDNSHFFFNAFIKFVLMLFFQTYKSLCNTFCKVDGQRIFRTNKS